LFGSEIRDPEKLNPDLDLGVENYRIAVPGSGPGSATLFGNNEHYRYPYLIAKFPIVIMLEDYHNYVP
jgi:hypothetical protein